MSEQYNFSACKKNVLGCIFKRHCQLEGQFTRCSEILGFIGLLSQNSHNLEIVQKNIYCPVKAAIISSYSCFRYQNLKSLGCENCREPGRDFLLITDLQKFLSLVRQEIAKIDEAARIKFKITESLNEKQISEDIIFDNDR